LRSEALPLKFTSRMSRVMAALILCLGWILSGAARADDAQATAPTTGIVTNVTVVEGAPATGPVQKSNVLRPNDSIWIKVYQEDDLETRSLVDKNGFITMPLLGPVRVGQKTSDEATAIIQALYAKDYLVNPKVTLMVIEKAKLRYTVMGQVQRPGTYEFPENDSLNLFQAIATAGGYTRLGAPNKVSVQRVQDGKPVVIPLNAEQMSKDKNAKPFELAPEDIVTVGERIF
jgi:protein involved in polysaccharide export with SLBB domain